ncbi:MAG: FliH/SctL family protein [Candidatus Melainabacteria bacterium]|nr:FliH/SctL family protein [Candidatus Melainabacteria bacterium]
MLIKAQKRKATAPTSFQNQSAARFEQPEQSMPPLQEVQIPQHAQAPVIQIDRAEIQKIVEIEKQAILQRFEAEVAEKRRAAEAEIQSKLEEIEINLTNIQRREHEIENILATEKQNLEAEKAAEQERIQTIEQQLQGQFETAIQQGFEQGYQEAKTNLDKVSNEFEEIIHNIHRSKEALLLEIEPQITSIALEVARKILQRESKLDSNLILEQVKSAVRKVTIRGGLLEVSINPDDTQHQTELESVLNKMLDKEVRLIFKEDPQVSQGSCIIDTQGGQLNANFKIQIESIKLAFEKYFGKEIILIEAPDEEEEITSNNEIELQEVKPEIELYELETLIEALPINTTTEAEETLGLEIKLESAIENKTNRDSKIEINNLETEKIVEFETATLDLEFISNPESENILELTPELADNQFIFESAADAQSQLTLNEAFSADALALMNELDSAFNQKHVNNSTDEYIDLETLDAELESVLNEDVNHTEIAATKDLNKTESSSEIDENREIENHNEIKNHSETEDINLEDLQALFAADDEASLDEETNADLDFILDQLKENTPIDLENDGSNESKVIEETDELDKIMDKSDLSKLDLNFDLESPDEEDLDALEDSMEALLTEVEGEDTDELEALLGSSSIKLDFSDDDKEEDLAEIAIDDDDDDDDDLPRIVIDELDEEDEVITTLTDEEEIDFSENPKKEPVFEEFDEAYDDDYSEGKDPRFPDY